MTTQPSGNLFIGELNRKDIRKSMKKVRMSPGAHVGWLLLRAGERRCDVDVCGSDTLKIIHHISCCSPSLSHHILMHGSVSLLTRVAHGPSSSLTLVRLMPTCRQKRLKKSHIVFIFSMNILARDSQACRYMCILHIQSTWLCQEYVPLSSRII